MLHRVAGAVETQPNVNVALEKARTRNASYHLLFCKNQAAV
jgi:hypothetical protein